jgi:ribosomal protein S25
MTRHLIIAGHGELVNGGFDTGATGHISKGEHLYVEEDLFPAMRKYAKDSEDTFIFHSAYKVLDRGNLVALAKQHNADTVTEIHYDAFNASATGGHVIVYSGYAPDDLDLRLRDVIGEVIGGLRFSHRGHRGISGRNNLGMINTAARNDINMRLLELGFGTNKREADIMVNQVDEYARKLIEAYDQSNHKAKPNEKAPAPPKKSSSKSIAQMADEVEAGIHGNGHANRRTSLGVSQSVYNQVRDEVNRRAGVTSRREAVKPKKSIGQMASEIIEGQHGQGHANRRRSLGVSQSEYNKVRAEVNRRAGVSTGKSIGQMANEILEGKHGNGHTQRRDSLGVDNATYQKVRAEVNRRS